MEIVEVGYSTVLVIRVLEKRFGCMTTDATEKEQQFWAQAVREGLPRFRWLRRSLRLSELDQRNWGKLQPAWETLKAKIQPGDRIWPFEFHVRPYLGMRQGIVVVRKKAAIGGIVIVVS
jgi:hypothetical protein